MSELEKLSRGDLWSWTRSVMSQGACIQQDYAAGAHKTYEHYSAHLDAQAAQRGKELWSVISSELDRLQRRVADLEDALRTAESMLAEYRKAILVMRSEKP